MIRLYHSPMACSLASRLALIESGLPHVVAIVRTWRGEQKAPEYLAINPRGKVPALATDAGVLTESIAILCHIAVLAPARNLLPGAGGFARSEAHSWLSFLSSSLHAAMTDPLFPRPGCENGAAREGTLARLSGVLATINERLSESEWLLKSFSVCDLYLAVFSTWRLAPQLAGALPDFPAIDRLQAAVLARPGLGAAFAEDMKMRAAG